MTQFAGRLRPSPPRASMTITCRLLTAVALAVGAASLLQAQIPGRNVNMVSGRTLPDGDPYLQRQNEPSIAASTRNPLHLLAGANDYRTVDLPGLPNSNETGDAWMGVFKSYDGGNTWRSSLIPGYPQDAGSTSPLKNYKAAADPVVRAGTNGLFYYSGIVFDRSSPSKSAMFVSRFIDNNNQEAGDPIVFLNTTLIATNAGTAFIDKPWFAVDVPRANAQTCTISTSQKSPTASEPNRSITTTQSFPGGAAYAAFSMITGEGADTRSQVYLSRSLDCGATWSTPQRISSLSDPINQGATLAIDPRNGTVYLAWRRFTSGNTDDSIMVTRSFDKGRKWDPPGRARRFPRGRKVGLNPANSTAQFKPPTVVSPFSSLDQPTQEDRFRTNAYPTMAIDGSGRVYVAWAERGFAPLNADLDEGDARILMATSIDGATWTSATPVDNGAMAGHQVMPTLTFAGGKLMIAYYDFREDVSGVFRKWVDEGSAVQFANKRHTVDVRAAMAAPAATPAFGASVRISEYLMGSRPGVGPRPVEQLQFNPPNLKLFKLGTVPFVGDYIDLTPSPAFVPTAGGWTYNTAPASSPLFHVVWTDNRDVVPPSNGDWTSYTPPGVTTGTSTYDGVTAVQVCVPGREGMRNQNIYTARITGGLVAGSPGNTKPLSPTLQRAFVVFAQNATQQVRTFRMTIENQPVGGRASFLQEPLPPYTAASPAPLTTLQVIVPARSTVARNVYATSSDPHAQLQISVKEILALDGPVLATGLQSTVVLNPDISNPDISNPDISNPDISNPDISNPDISNPDISNAEVSNPDISNPDISNPDISNPDISNPDISNPDISNPDISNVQVANPDISNPDISNPDISNPDISNPDISNPDISNPDISNQSLTDTTWTITNDGNTTASYSVKLLLNGAQPTVDQVAVQLILRKVYTTPVAVNCTLGLHAHNVLLANITNPDFSTLAEVNNPDISNPDISNATLWLAPGETAKITLRVMDKNTSDGVTFSAVDQVTPAVVSQALNVAVVDGQLVVAAQEAIAFPPALNLQMSAPANVISGVAVGPVFIQVTDEQGAALPGVNLQMAVVSVPSDVPVTPTSGLVTNVDGTGVYNVGVLAPGTYRVRAQATFVGYSQVVRYSSNFTVLPPPTLLSVTNTNSAGAGSLAQAILDSNASGGVVNTISFSIPGLAPHVINLTARLPTILDPVVIDAAPAGGCNGTAPAVEISGGALTGAAGPGLLVTAGNTTIRGLSITSFLGSGIEWRTAGNNRLECSYLGLMPDGVTAKPNASNGIQIVDTVGNTIGGPNPLARNVISGNTGEGVRIDGALATGNVVQGNYIGTDATGTADRGNGASGVYLRRAPANVVADNIVAGNNGFAGIAVCGAAACGGGAAGTQAGDAAGNFVRGNLVGTNLDGTDLGNTGFGISIDSASATVVGVVGSANTIAYNSVGVRVFGTDTTGARLSRNSITANDGLGIDLGTAGVTPNDAGDGDTGPNGLQNFPTVTTAARQNDGTTFIQGTLNSTPNTEFVIELFDNKGCDALGNGEGQTWIATVTGISTDGNGDMIFSTTYGGLLLTGNSVTATATDPAGRTSEFSSCAPVKPVPQAVGPVGGNGGNAFSLSCPAGSVATALRGRAGEEIDRTELWCSPLLGGAASFAGGVGGFGGNDYGGTLTCPAGSVVTGLHGRAGVVRWGGNVVDTLGVTCTAPGGAVSTLGPVGDSWGTPQFNLSCPAGKQAVGIFGGQGGLLDRIGVYCQ